MRNSYPNPFRAGTSAIIEVGLKAGETGTVTIYNVHGQTVRSFAVSEGFHTLNWDGRDANGKACASGIYFYRLTTPSVNQTRKLVMAK
jgi:flagellar hook assembly protein FlgD